MAQPTINPPPHITAAISALTATLDETYRIKITDGRTFIGQFVCLDAQGNLVLDNTIERVENHEREEANGDREVGLVLLKKKWWVKVERLVRGGDMTTKT